MKFLAVFLFSLTPLMAMNIPKCPFGQAQKTQSEKLIAYYCKKNGVNHGLFWSYYKNQREFEKGEYQNGKRHGLYKRYSPKGKLEYLAMYQAGKKHGQERIYLDQGDELLISKKNFKHDILEGKIQLFYNNGKVKFVAHAKGGQLHGKYRKLFRFGGTAETGQYAAGKLDGVIKIFYPHGKVKWQAKFQQEKPVGKIVSYDVQGKEVEREDFRDSNQIIRYRLPGLRQLTGISFADLPKEKLQERAKSQLKEIFHKELAYKKKIGGFSSDLAAIGFEVRYPRAYYVCGFYGPSIKPFPYPGNHRKGQHYSLHARVKKVDGFIFPAHLSPEDLIGTVEPRNFTASCVGNIDEDVDLDVWTINEHQELKHLSQD